MLDILRGAAGALSDLVEDQGTAKGVADKHPAENRGSDRPDPGAKEKSAPSKGKPRTPSEYSYESEEDAAKEEEASEEEPEADYERSPSVERKGESAPPPSRPSVKPRVATDVDPNYLSKALHLKAAPKAGHRQSDHGRYREERGEEPSRGHKRREDEEKKEHRGPGGGGHQRPVTPEREPLQRRKPPPRQKKRKRGSGGKSKRQRASDFKEWVQHRKAQKTEKGWHQKQK